MLDELGQDAAAAAGGQGADLFASLRAQGQQDRYAAALNNYNMLQDAVSMMLGQAPVSNRILKENRPRSPKESDLVKNRFIGKQIAGIA